MGYHRPAVAVVGLPGSAAPFLGERLHALGSLCSQRNDFKEAETHFLRAISIRESTFGPDNAELVNSLNNLSETNHAQGNYAEAESLLQRSLAILEKALGPEHPNVAASLGNYAALLSKSGQADEEAEMEARAEAICAKYE
jgi:tetratricopeptide (TPR) repeat protein